jgi:hypothetical protein
MKEILPFLLVLVCPLMMIFMMRGMRGGGDHAGGRRGDGSRQVHDASTDSMSAGELGNLRDDIDERLQEMDARIDQMGHTAAPESQKDAVRT